MTAAATSGINEDLLRRVLEHITAHPEEHAQRRWAVQVGCGTAYCVAGWAAVMTGHTPSWEGLYAERTVDGEYIDCVAMSELRLPVPGERLFASENSLDDLWRIAAELTDGRVSRTTPTK